MAEVLQFNLRQLGIDLEVKYFDFEAVFERTTIPGEPFDIVLGGWVADYPDPWGFFGSLLDPQVGPLRVTVDPRVLRRMERANRLPAAAREPCLGGDRRRPDAQRPTLGAVRPPPEPHVRVPEPRLLPPHPDLRRRDHGALQEVDGARAHTLRPDRRRGGRTPRRCRSRGLRGRRANERRSRRAEGRHAPHRGSQCRFRRSRARLLEGRVADPGRDVRAALPLPECPETAACRCCRRSRPLHRLAGRPHAHASRCTRPSLPHRRQGDRPELRGRVRPERLKLRSPAAAYMHEIVGADAVTDGKAQSIAGVRVLGRIPPADQAHEATPRSPGAADDAVLLPRSAEHARRPRWDPQSGGLRPVLRRRACRESAHPAEAKPLLPRRAPGERRPDGLDDRGERRGMSARGRRGPGRLLRPTGRSARRLARTSREVRCQPARRPALRQPHPRDALGRVQPRSARFPGDGSDPAQEGDQLRHRPACHGAPVRLPRRQAHRPAAAALPRQRLRASTRSAEQTSARRGAGTRGRGSGRRKLVYYTANTLPGSRWHRPSRSTSSRSGSTSR